MARFYRLALLLICSLAAFSSFAAVPLQNVYWSYGYPEGAPSASELCSILLGKQSPGPDSVGETRQWSISSVTDGMCQLKAAIYRKDGTFKQDSYSSIDIFIKQGACPSNSTRAQLGSGCVCNKGYFESGNQCVAAQSPDDKCAGDFNMAAFGVGTGKLTETVTLKGDVASGSMCHPHDSPTSGCTVQFRADKVVEMPDGSKQTIGQYGMYKGPSGGVQGKACDIPAGQPGEGTEVDANCKKSGYAGSESVGGRKVCLDAPECPGGFGGEVNGVSVCVKDEGTNIVKSEKKTEKKNADGSTEKKTEKTTCQGKECKTETTTTTTPAGGGSSVTNVTNVSQSKDDYCKNNADSAQCKGDSKGDGKDGGGSFGGSCEAGFSCEGDALQCAQLREQYKRNCEMMDKDKDANSLSNKALNGTDEKSADALKASASQVDVGGSFDQSGFGWSHACPADTRIPLNFGGVSSEFTIPYGNTICGPLSVLSLAAVGLVSLGCLVWVVGGKQGG